MIPNTLRVKLTSIVAFWAVAACTTNNPDASADRVADVAGDSTSTRLTDVQTMADSAAIPITEVALNEEVTQWSDSLKKYFNADELSLIDRALSKSKAITTASELAQ